MVFYLEASMMGPAGEDTVVELHALEQWVRTAREKQADRDDAIRRRQRHYTWRMASDAAGAAPIPSASPATSYPVPIKTVGQKFNILMSAAADGVDTLRGAIIELARAGEVDDVLLVMINSNGDNARDSGDPGRANFLYKLAEVCVREKKAAEGEW